MVDVPDNNTYENDDEEGVRRRAACSQLYAALPDYATGAFWEEIQAPEIPLEVLTRCLRTALAYQDTAGWRRIFELIILYTQEVNECWVRKVLQGLALTEDERDALMDDLRADLYEHLLRALLDPQRLFWEENFWHCLRFERKHVYQRLLMREGIWSNSRSKKSTRIPRELMVSLNQTLHREENEDNRYGKMPLEDEQAQKQLRAVEESDLLLLVLHLPQKFKAVVLLVFWEGRTEAETARVLGISDRTVRNRIQAALKLLRESLLVEWEMVYG